MTREPLVGREEYDGFDRHGSTKYVTAWRFGRGRWRVEVTASGLYVRLGRVEFSAGFEWAER
jgi:hypothetical protein